MRQKETNYMLMKTLVSLKDLFIDQLRDLYDGEQQRLEAIPRFSIQVKSEKLRKSLEHTIRETQQQALRLDRMFLELNESPKGESCEVMKCLVEKTYKLIRKSADHEVLEAGMINHIQFINHYEIAAYGSLCAYANILGYGNVARLLHQSLKEIKSLDKELTQLAEESINKNATSLIIS